MLVHCWQPFRDVVEKPLLWPRPFSDRLLWRARRRHDSDVEEVVGRGYSTRGLLDESMRASYGGYLVGTKSKATGEVETP